MVLIIGATSFLGPVVLEKLLKKNHKVSCLVRSDSKRDKLLKASEKATKEIIFSIGTLQSEDSIFNNIKDIDSIIYLVGLENTYFIKNFLRSAARTKLKRAVFLSSTTVLLPFESIIKEAKITSENLIKNSNLNWTILRPTMIYGSIDDTNFSKMIDFIKRKGFFITFGSGENLIQPICIEDVADAAVNVLDNSNTYRKVYEICGKEPITYNEMLKIVQDKMEKPFKIIKLPLNLSSFLISLYNKFSKNPVLTSAQIERMKIDKAYYYEEAIKDFGFSPKSFEYGIGKLIDKLDKCQNKK